MNKICMEEAEANRIRRTKDSLFKGAYYKKRLYSVKGVSTDRERRKLPIEYLLSLSNEFCYQIPEMFGHIANLLGVVSL